MPKGSVMPSGRIASVIDETNLIRGLPRLRLTALPTPLDRAAGLEEALPRHGPAAARRSMLFADLSATPP
jgi:hypothetical protein